MVFWLVVGAVVVRWYDRKGFNRMDPELLGYVGGSVQQYKSRIADAGQQDSESAAARHRLGAEPRRPRQLGIRRIAQHLPAAHQHDRGITSAQSMLAEQRTRRRVGVKVDPDVGQAVAGRELPQPLGICR